MIVDQTIEPSKVIVDSTIEPPLCGTSWDKWNWDKLHCGYRACPGTRKGLQLGYMTCSMGQERSLLTFPSPGGTGLVQAACLSHWDKHNLSQSACPTGTVCACPSCLFQWDRVGSKLVQAPPFQSWSFTKFRFIPYQKKRGSSSNFGNSLSDSLSNWSKIETINQFFCTFSIVN